MHSFTQFTRNTRWGEFAWVGATIFNENFMVSGQFPGRQFSSGAIVGGREQFSLGATVRGGIIQGAIIQGEIVRGAIFFWGNYPRG